MKILLIGNAQTQHLLRWAQFFSKRNHSVYVASMYNPCKGDWSNISVKVLAHPLQNRSLFSRILNMPPQAYRLKKLIKNIKPDVLHAHDASGCAWLSMWSGFKPLIVSCQGTDILIRAQSNRLDRWLTKRALNYANYVHVDGFNTWEGLRRLGIMDNKILRICYGTDISKFRPPTDKFEAKRKLGLEGMVITSTRRLDPIHNVTSFVESIPLISEKFPLTTFIIIGWGSEEKKIRTLIGELGVEDRVKILGRVTEYQIIEYLQATDVFVVTSLSDSGIAASTAEAMACELPVVTTDIGDIRWWMQDEENGFILPVKQPKLIAEKVCWLLQNRYDANNMGRNNRNKIERDNNYQTEMDKFNYLYEKAIQ